MAAQESDPPVKFKTCRRLKEVGHAHALTFSCFQRRPFLTSQRSWLKLPVTRKAIAHVTAYAPEFLRQMKDSSPQGDHLRFWQRGGGFDRNVWSETVLLKEIDYFHANPVRRGLCQRPEDWRWSSAGDYLGIGQGPLDLDLQSLPRFFQTER
jgi:putative transposase